MNSRMIQDITNFIFINDAPQKVDALFLPGGSDPDIPEKAAELYKSGYAPILVPSGGVGLKTGTFAGVKRKKEIYNGDYKTDCAFYMDVFLKNGVPQTAIIKEDKSGYTKENALLTRNVLDGMNITISKAIVVCKSFHARRCLMCYQLAFPKAEILICAVDVYGINKDDWYTQENGIDRVMGELYRCGSQFVDEVKGLLK